MVLKRRPGQKDQTLRFCIDYRRANQLIVKDKIPLAGIDDCLEALGECRYFSTCDLRQGYWKTVIDERDRDKTTFVTRKGQWRFKVKFWSVQFAYSFRKDHETYYSA